MKIIDGKKIALEIQEELQKEIVSLGFKPGLAIILIGNNAASEIYVRNKIKACEKIGIKGVVYRFDEDSRETDIINTIIKLNQDKNIQGIIVQSPVPKVFNGEVLLSYIDPLKDVDGFLPLNMGYVATNKTEGILAATPYGIIKMLEYEEVSLVGKNVVIVGRSNIVGRPLALALLNKDATVTIAHSKTKDLKNITNKADILVVAIGKSSFITEDYIKDGAIVIDVGINRVNDKLYGDVDFLSVSKKASLITPVPGGVGPVTIAMLLYNTVKAAKKNNKIEKELDKNG